MNQNRDRLLRKLNDIETERILARDFEEDGDFKAAYECFRSARLILHEIDDLFSRASRARTPPTRG